MRIAVPIAGGQFCQHFGGAESFALFTADEEARTITGREDARPPAHERGVFPAWLRDQGVKTVLAGVRDAAVEELAHAGSPAHPLINAHRLMPNPQLEHRGFLLTREYRTIYGRCRRFLHSTQH